LDRVLLDLWQAIAQGWVHLDPEVCRHLMTRWHDLVRSQHNLKVPA
jgi:hypothetical protein